MLLRQPLGSPVLRLGLGLALVAALGLALLPSCSSGPSNRAARGVVVRVTERDFRIKVSPARVRAGNVRLLIRNEGPDTHELLVVRAPRGRLALRSDALTVNEEALDGATAGEEEAQEPGSVHELVVRLKPGRYELFCNMAGHYLGGMSAELEVT
jgi:uncharacterized cupredoxin-like copper-binding protein